MRHLSSSTSKNKTHYISFVSKKIVKTTLPLTVGHVSDRCLAAVARQLS